jgi:DeoR family transcriptional regulator, ulaG and ulaABCDEF operon transcriptional repressor
VSISDLGEMLDASEPTVRHDVNAMADRSEIRRIRGGAAAIRPRHEAHLVGMLFAVSRDIHVPQKRAIARAAAALIEDGYSIIVSGGTTTFALVDSSPNAPSTSSTTRSRSRDWNAFQP